MDSWHLVFVYGTLKAGEPNQSKMTDEATGRAEFVGIGTTLTKFPLVIGSRYNVPFLLAKEGIGKVRSISFVKNVEGEVYRVDDEKLKSLDVLEEHPQFYTQREEQILLVSGETVAAWIYLLPVWRDELLASEHLVSYSSKGPHGRELFVPSVEFLNDKDNLRRLKNELIAEMRAEY